MTEEDTRGEVAVSNPSDFEAVTKVVTFGGVAQVEPAVQHAQKRLDFFCATNLYSELDPDLCATQ